MPDASYGFVMFADNVDVAASPDGYALLRFSVEKGPNDQKCFFVALPEVVASSLSDRLGQVTDRAGATRPQA